MESENGKSETQNQQKLIKKILQSPPTQLNPLCLKLFSISNQTHNVEAIVFKEELISVGKLRIMWTHC